MNPDPEEIEMIKITQPAPKDPALTPLEKDVLELLPPDRRTYPKTFPYRNRTLQILRVSHDETRALLLSNLQGAPMAQRLDLIERLWAIYVDELTQKTAGPKQFNIPASQARQAKAKARKIHARNLARQQRKQRRKK